MLVSCTPIIFKKNYFCFKSLKKKLFDKSTRFKNTLGEMQTRQRTIQPNCLLEWVNGFDNGRS